MARVSVLGTPFEKALLNDLDKKQREHTINPPGQERYVRPINSLGELTVALTALGGSAVAAEIPALIAATVTADDLSIATLTTQLDLMTGISGTTTPEAQAIQDILSYKLIETGNMLLSFHNGVLKGMVDAGWIKVFTDDGTTLFSL